MPKHTHPSTRGGVCRNPRLHEHDAWLLAGAAVMGTWKYVPQINLEVMPCGHQYVWRVLSCGCAAAVPLTVGADL